EKIITDYPYNRVVMLPQTIFYKEESEFDRTAEVFNKHDDVHLYVRDTLSYEMATKKFHRCSVQLMPDMSHQLWPIQPKSNPGKEMRCFFRTDIEKTSEQEQLESSGRGDYLDWTSLYNRVEKKSINSIVRL